MSFLVSFYLIREYASSRGNDPQHKKYVSYAVLKDSLFPAIKTGNMQFASQAAAQYFEQVNR